MNTEKIKQAMEKKEITLYKLSQIANVPYSTLYDITNNKTINPKINTINSIASILELSIDELIERNE